MLGVILSTQVVLYTLFGGVGTLIGAVIGVIGIEVLSYVLADNYQEIWPIILGALLLAVILLRPTGLISLIVPERERIGNFGRVEDAPGGRDASMAAARGPRVDQESIGGLTASERRRPDGRGQASFTA